MSTYGRFAVSFGVAGGLAISAFDTPPSNPAPAPAKKEEAKKPPEAKKPDPPKEDPKKTRMEQRDKEIDRRLNKGKK